MPPTLAQRVQAALAKVDERLGRGDIVGAREEIARGRELSTAEPRLAMAGLTGARWDDLQQVVQSMPDAAIQVLKHAHLRPRELRSTATSLTAEIYSPFSALGVPRLHEARKLNTVNKRELQKQYWKLARDLHPDKCDHEYAVPAMQALNKAFAHALPPSKADGKTKKH